MARIDRRWSDQGFESDAESADGPGLLRPVGVAVALARAGKCTSSRCDDGIDLDTDAECRTCERQATERLQAATQPVQGAFPMIVPTGSNRDAGAPHGAAPHPAPGRRLVLRPCDGDCDRAIRTAPAPAPAGLCRDCRQTAATSETGT